MAGRGCILTIAERGREVEGEGSARRLTATPPRRTIAAGGHESDMLRSKNELFKVLGRNPVELKGEPETSWLEFKSAPYPIYKQVAGFERHRFELAKDLTALANKDGGVILIGVETEKDAASKEDVAKELRPVAPGWIKAELIKQVIHDWVYPRLEVEVLSHSVSGEIGELWSLSVERFRDIDYPYIVTKNFVGNGGASPNIFGVFERSGSHNNAYSPQQVHHWVNTGTQGLPQGPVAVLSQPADEADEVLAEDFLTLALGEHEASVYLQAAPKEAGSLTRFYQGHPESLHDALISPRHHLREHGFNLPDIGRPERSTRGALRVVWLKEGSISITPSGLTTAIQGQSLLTWGAKKYAPEGEYWINPLALIEFTLDFCRFFLAEVVSRSQSTGLLLKAGMRGLVEAAGALYLPQELNRRTEKERAMADTFDLDWIVSDGHDANQLAYEVLAKLYDKFGFDKAVIPYTEGNSISDTKISTA